MPDGWYCSFWPGKIFLCTILYILIASLYPVNVIGQGSIIQPEKLFKEFRHGSHSEVRDRMAEMDALIQYYDSIGDQCKVAVLIGRKGLTKANLNQEDEAISDVIQAIKLSDKNHCSDQVNVYLHWVYAGIYIQLNEQDKADSICRIGINMYQDDWDDRATLIGLYLHLGNRSDTAEALISYLDTAYELARKFGERKLESIALTAIGAFYADKGEFNKAREYFESAVQIKLEINDQTGKYALFNNLAGVMALSSEEYNISVLEMVDSAIYYARKVNDLESVQEGYENKAYYLRMHGQFDTAYGTLWRAHVLKDSLVDIAKYEAVAEMEEKYEAEKKSNEIQSLKVQNLNAEVENLRIKKNQNKLIIGSIILLFGIAFLAFNFFVLRKNRNLLAHKNKMILEEQARSNGLLLNILPKEVAEDLKRNGYSSAKKFVEATILFTDFINFTQASELMETEELVNELNTYFMKFDEIVERYGVEKIKTIGDSYMAAGGLPIHRQDTIKNTVLAALEMQDFVQRRAAEREKEGKVPFKMRTGLHTGQVVAGIVGKKKYQYDVWGDTVNTASRMESNGVAGKVNISKSTFEFLKDDPEFAFEYRGKINAKGKGDIDMYFVSKKVSDPVV